MATEQLAHVARIPALVRLLAPLSEVSASGNTRLNGTSTSVGAIGDSGRPLTT